MGITLARRRCASCHRTTGYALWPWSGRVFVTSHGLCRGCLQRTRRALTRAYGPREVASEPLG